MTSVAYEYAAEVRRGDTWTPLPVTDIVPSADLDRVPYADATLTLGAVPNAVWALLDPRTVDPQVGGRVRWRIRQRNPAGALLGYLPRVADHGPELWAVMYVREASRNLGSVTLTLAGAETMIDDRIIIEDTTHFVEGWEISRELLAGRTVGDLVDTVLALTFGAGHAEPADPTAVAALAVSTLPSFGEPGFEVDATPGASFLQLVETQLSATGCRLVDLWGAAWVVAARDRMPTFDGAPSALRWASYDDNLPVGVTPAILDLSETVSRDGDWADVVAVEGTDGELNTWRHLAAGGHHSRGRILTMNSAEPSANLAASIAARTFRRGHDIALTIRISLDVVPGMSVELHTRSGVTAAEIRSVEWRTDEGEMTVHARATTDLNITATDTTAPPSPTEKALAGARAFAHDAYTSAVAQIPQPDTQQAAWEAAQLAGEVL